MTVEQATEIVRQLKRSYLYMDAGYSLMSAAECYDGMNDTDEHQTALKTLGLWLETA